MDGTAWSDLYRDYLRSQEWALKRAKVMRRAGYRCEGCGDNPAAEVHHLTYANVTREFLFELVALCADCHERLHVQRGQPERPNTVTWQRRHSPGPAPKGETPTGRRMREQLEAAAVEHRRKFMAMSDEERRAQTLAAMERARRPFKAET